MANVEVKIDLLKTDVARAGDVYLVTYDAVFEYEDGRTEYLNEFCHAVCDLSYDEKGEKIYIRRPLEIVKD